MTRRRIGFCGFLMVLLGSMPMCFGAGFQNSMTQIGALRAQKKYAPLISLLVASKAPANLEDIRLFLLGEAYRSMGDNQQAAEVFARLHKERPQSVGARRSRFLSLMARLQSGLSTNPKEISDAASSLPTAYQRGKVLETLVTASENPQQRGPIALKCLRAYHSETAFYQTMPEAKSLLEMLLQHPGQFHLSRNDWLEVFLWANREGLNKLVVKVIPGFSGIFGVEFAVIGKLIKGDALVREKNKVPGLEILSSVVNQANLAKDLRAYGHQLRGDTFHLLGRHDAAVHDFQKALEWGKPPVDVVAARYRLMRSLFELGYDKECLVQLGKLQEFGHSIPVMPIHVYEMGLQRFDAREHRRSIPFFQQLAKQFPGHYRADDGLGYSVLASGGASTPEGKACLQKLEERYPHSFFLYWAAPSRRDIPFIRKQKLHPIPPAIKTRLETWQKLLGTPLAEIAIGDIRETLAENPGHMGVYRAATEAYRDADEFNQLSGCGERLLRETLDAGKTGYDLPDWAWKAYFPKPFWTTITQYAKTYKLDPYWVISIMREESHFNPKTLSRSNAMGLMQILPSTGKWIAEKLGIKGKFHKDSLWEIQRNIAFGCWYLGYLRDLFNGDLFLAAAAYNGGQGNILRKVEQGPHARLPVLERLDRVPLPETRDYFKKVMGSRWCYQRLYKD
jgi:soluble lytic murein transglycosylase